MKNVSSRLWARDLNMYGFDVNLIIKIDFSLK